MPIAQPLLKYGRLKTKRSNQDSFDRTKLRKSVSSVAIILDL